MATFPFDLSYWDIMAEVIAAKTAIRHKHFPKTHADPQDYLYSQTPFTPGFQASPFILSNPHVYGNAKTSGSPEDSNRMAIAEYENLIGQIHLEIKKLKELAEHYTRRREAVQQEEK